MKKLLSGIVIVGAVLSFLACTSEVEETEDNTELLTGLILLSAISNTSASIVDNPVGGCGNPSVPTITHGIAKAGSTSANTFDYYKYTGDGSTDDFTLTSSSGDPDVFIGYQNIALSGSSAQSGIQYILNTTGGESKTGMTTGNMSFRCILVYPYYFYSSNTGSYSITINN